MKHVVTFCSSSTFSYGEFLLHPGELAPAQLQPHPDQDMDPLYRLYDAEAPDRKIFASPGEFAFVSNNELLEAALDPSAWLDKKGIE